ACAQAGRWREAGINLGLAINLSGRELSDDRLVSLVSHHLTKNKLPPQSVTLELTETEVMADLAEVSAVLVRLSRLGVRIAVDDYGTGYSSLAYLHRLPVQELKIDRSFVTNLVDDPSNRIIVRSSIAMAHSLGLTVVAEGAEDEVTCAVLADAGCDAVQGYYFSRPKTAGELQRWLIDGATLSYSKDLPPLRPLRILEGDVADDDRQSARRGSGQA
ncbi:MAG TPA: EAL domain-containing protein, partial [Acidimicrobiales bacterium]|nr:EAL domain-containing protein [Acidimicrobiales bacterium]